MGLYDRDYMKSEEWQRRHGYYPSRPSEESKPSEEIKPSQRSKPSGEKKVTANIGWMIVAIVGIIIASYLSPSCLQIDSSDNLSTNSSVSTNSLRFDTETIDPEENNWYNFFVAARHLKQWKHSNINKAQKVNIIDLYLYTSSYIGKLVRLNMEVLTAKELPPSNDASKILNPGKATKVILSGVYIGDVIVIIQYHYAGSSEFFADGDNIELCGYVIGKSRNINNLGGTYYSIILAGKYIKRLR